MNIKVNDSQKQKITKPKTLACYICGRQFGTKSLIIHLKKCQQKFTIQQNNKFDKDLRIKLPQPPKLLQQILDLAQKNLLDENIIQEFNAESFQIYKYKILPSCKYCGRTFNEESLISHVKACQKQNQNKKSVPGKVQRNGSKNNQSRSNSKSYQLQDQYKKPKTLVCCVCGRQFGLSSLKIHYPQCQQKFYNQEFKKPKKQRNPVPKFSEQHYQMMNNKIQWNIPQIQQFNKIATQNYRNKALVQCLNCKRKFLPQSLKKHQKNCKLINGDNKNITNESKYSEYSSSNIQQPRKPKVLMCYLCGRQFGLTSLKIHQKKCIQKFHIAQMKKQKKQRRKLPQLNLDEQQYNLDEAIQWPMQKINRYNELANQVYKGCSLFPCNICGRRFFQEALAKHINYCQKNAAKNAEKIQMAKSSQTQELKRKPNTKDNSMIKNNKSTKKILLQENIEDKNENQNQSQRKNQSVVKNIIKKQKQKEQTQKQEQKILSEITFAKQDLKELKKNQPQQKQQQIVSKEKQIDKANSYNQTIKQVNQQLEDTIKQNLKQKLKQSNKQLKQQQIQKQEIRQNKQKQNQQPQKSPLNTLQQQQQNQRVKCSKCQRKFTSDRIEKHQSICKGSNKLNQDNMNNKIQKKQSQNKSKIQKIIRSQKKIQKKIDSQKIKQQQNDHFQNFVQQKPSKPQKIKQNNKQLNEQKNEQTQNKNELKQQTQYQSNINQLIACKKCGKKIIPIKLQKHEQKCKDVAFRVRNTPNKKQLNSGESQKNDNKDKNKQNLDIRTKQFNEFDYQKEQQIKQIKLSSKSNTQNLRNRNQSFKHKNVNIYKDNKSTINKHKPQQQDTNQFFKKEQNQKKQFKINQNNPNISNQIKDKNSVKNQQQQKVSMLDNIEKDFQVIDRVECKKCNRKFLADRIQKHQNICKGIISIPSRNIQSKKQQISQKKIKSKPTFINNNNKKYQTSSNNFNKSKTQFYQGQNKKQQQKSNITNNEYKISIPSKQIIHQFKQIKSKRIKNQQEIDQQIENGLKQYKMNNIKNIKNIPKIRNQKSQSKKDQIKQYQIKTPIFDQFKKSKLLNNNGNNNNNKQFLSPVINNKNKWKTSQNFYNNQSKNKTNDLTNRSNLIEEQKQFQSFNSNIAKKWNKNTALPNIKI